MLDPNPAASGGDDASLPEAPRIERHVPDFSGRAGEFFGIWFVNLLLSVVTLGIYSAWAKVRTERYFYGNTRLAGSSFDYLASPIAILKCRLIAYAVVIALYLSSHFSMSVYFALLAVIVALMPVLVVLTLRFRARNSAWRGLTFRFLPTPASAYGPFLGWPILSLLSLTLLHPVATKRQHSFVAEGHRFGQAPFSFSADIGEYYTPYIISMGMGVALMFAFAGIFMLAMLGSGGQAPTTPGPEAGVAMIAAMVVLYAGMFGLMIYLQVRYGNLFWNSTRLGEHRFESSLRVRDMLWIYASNLVAIVFTIGMAAPWAMIRLARYRAAHFVVITQGSIDDFLAAAEGGHSATGAEMVDALDLGVDFGI